MTEKRYYAEAVPIGFNQMLTVQYYDNGRELHTTTVVDLLNNQEEQIQFLKISNDSLDKFIKSNFDEYMTQKRLNERINKLEQENQRLNLTIKGLRYVLQNIKQIDVDIDLSDLEIGDD